jgi:hypothetical protein
MAKQRRTQPTTEYADDRGDNQPHEAEDVGFETLQSALADAQVITRSKPEEAELVAEVTVPICECVPSEFGLHIDTDIPPPAATTLRRIAMALDRRQAKLASGIRVTNPTQALRYLLEQMSIRPAAG